MAISSARRMVRYFFASAVRSKESESFHQIRIGLTEINEKCEMTRDMARFRNNGKLKLLIIAGTRQETY